MVWRPNAQSLSEWIPKQGMIWGPSCKEEDRYTDKDSFPDLKLSKSTWTVDDHELRAL